MHGAYPERVYVALTAPRNKRPNGAIKMELLLAEGPDVGGATAPHSNESPSRRSRTRYVVGGRPSGPVPGDNGVRITDGPDMGSIGAPHGLEQYLRTAAHRPLPAVPM